MKVGLLNIGIGNILSVYNALHHLEVPCGIIQNSEDVEHYPALIMPGVGAFSEAMSSLRNTHLFDAIQTMVRVNKRPLLGICLGHQLLSEFGDEGGATGGLGFLPGDVTKLQTKSTNPPIRLPHIGWNTVKVKQNSMMFQSIPDGTSFYFLHSYHVRMPELHVLATCHYGEEFTAAAEADNLWSVQFHPEKSHRAGLRLLRNWLNWSKQW